MTSRQKGNKPMFVLNLFYEKEKNPKLTRFIAEKLQESGIPIKRPRNHLLVTDHPVILAGLEATDVTEGMFLEHAKAMFNTQNNINAYLTSSNTGEMPLLTKLTAEGIPCRTYSANEVGAMTLVRDVASHLKNVL